MFGASLTASTDVLEDWRAFAGRYPKLAMTRFRRMAQPIRKRVLLKVRVKPGRVVYANNGKLRWSSRRQQKAFFASDGFGGGIPHIRTDAYIDGYDVEYVGSDFDGFMQVTNSHPDAEHIGGDDQEPFLMDTEWLKLSSVIDEEQPAVQELLAEQIRFLDDPTQGLN